MIESIHFDDYSEVAGIPAAVVRIRDSNEGENRLAKIVLIVEDQEGNFLDAHQVTVYSFLQVAHLESKKMNLAEASRAFRPTLEKPLKP